MDIFLGGGGGGGGSSQNWTIFRAISMHFRIFSEGQGPKLGIFFWVAKFSNIFWGA